MPNRIKTADMKRMFPYAFYNELNDKLNAYTLNNPAFLVDTSPDKKEALYHKTRPDELLDTINQQNILAVEPFGELLQLDLCLKTKDVPDMLDPKKRAGVPLQILVCQLYDSSGEPVFSESVTEETIEQIPEVLWDDPNLLLAILEYQEDGAEMAILQLPPHIQEKVFEEKPDEETNTK